MSNAGSPRQPASKGMETVDFAKLRKKNRKKNKLAKASRKKNR